MIRSLFGGVSTKKLVESIQDNLTKLEQIVNESTENDDSAGSDAVTKIQDKIAVDIKKMKDILFGENRKAPDPARCAKLGIRTVEAGLMMRLVMKIADIGFEARKSVKDIFITLTNHDYGNFQTEFLMHTKNSAIFVKLLGAYERKPEIALVCGEMLRVCLSKKPIVKLLLTMDTLRKFFDDYLHKKNFTVWSDALSTFKMFVESDYMTDFLSDDDNYETFFRLFHAKLVLKFEEYVTVRESLKILGEMLLKRSNYGIMMKYIGNKENLKCIMTAMTSKAANIKTEAFHVFKVFVANPKKSRPVHELLYCNRDKLIKYLEKFHSDSTEEQTGEEQKLLITTLRRLKPLEPLEKKASPKDKETSSPAAGDSSSPKSAAT